MMASSSSNLRRFVFASLLAFVAGERLGAQTVTLDNFSSGASNAVKNGTSWVNNVTRNPDTITVGGTARNDNGWERIGLSINASSMTHVTVTAQVDTGHLAPSLVVELQDANLGTHQVSISTSAFATGTLTTVNIPIGTWPSRFLPGSITGWNIGGGTPPLGQVAFRMTFDNLSLTGGAAPQPPTITAQPLDRAIGIGTGTTMTVTANANNSGTLRYQWKKDNVDVSGATQATLSLANVTLAHAGLYHVVVNNDVGPTPSNHARLTVLDAQPTHALGPGNTGYAAGDTVTISNTMVYGGTATSLRWSVVLPDGWTFASSSGATGATPPAPGTPSLIEWVWTSVPASPLTFTYTLNVPIGTDGDRLITALVAFRQNGATGNIIVKSDPLVVRNMTSRHSADTDGNFQISLFELTRVIELYNTRNGTVRTGAYDRATTITEDGFMGAPGRAGVPTTLTRYHSADSNRDGMISLFELTRVIELYNYRNGTVRTGAYHVDPNNTEDGFAAGP
jgi:hypothetical protein